MGCTRGARGVHAGCTRAARVLQGSGMSAEMLDAVQMYGDDEGNVPATFQVIYMIGEHTWFRMSRPMVSPFSLDGLHSSRPLTSSGTARPLVPMASSGRTPVATHPQMFMIHRMGAKRLPSQALESRLRPDLAQGTRGSLNLAVLDVAVARCWRCELGSALCSGSRLSVVCCCREHWL